MDSLDMSDNEVLFNLLSFLKMDSSYARRIMRIF